MKNLGILLSGRGSNFEAIARNVQTGQIPARIAVVISNRSDAPGLRRARAMSLNAAYIPSQGKEREAYDREIVAALQEAQVDLVCLAGFMRILSPGFVLSLHGRLVNIHPSLLPAFPGLHAQRQALDHGAKVAGVTVHFVDDGVDTGPIIAQASVPVRDDDTEASLSARILVEEHRLYPEVVRLFAERRLRLVGRRVEVSR